MGQPGPGLDLGPTDAKRNLRPNCEALRSLPRQTSVSRVPRAEDTVLASSLHTLSLRLPSGVNLSSRVRIPYFRVPKLTALKCPLETLDRQQQLAFLLHPSGLEGKCPESHSEDHIC